MREDNNKPATQIEPKVHDPLQMNRESRHDSDSGKPMVSVGLHIAIIISTIIIPIIGIAMGYTYYRKGNSEARTAGKKWLILGLIMFLLNVLLVSSMR